MAKRKKKRRRLYRKNGRFYGDFRDFSEVGGGQEALIPDGERYATKIHRVAKRLSKTRLKELRRLKKAGHSSMEADLRRLGPFVDYHLEQEAKRQGAIEATRSITTRLPLTFLLHSSTRAFRFWCSRIAIPSPRT